MAVVTTGRPLAIASRMTVPVTSVREGWTSRSAAAIAAPSAASLTKPSQVTRDGDAHAAGEPRTRRRAAAAGRFEAADDQPRGRGTAARAASTRSSPLVLACSPIQSQTGPAPSASA